MKSPASDCIRDMIRFYNSYAGNGRFYIHEVGHPLRFTEYCIDPEVDKQPWFDYDLIDPIPYPDDETFDDYCFRIINND